MGRGRGRRREATGCSGGSSCLQFTWRERQNQRQSFSLQFSVLILQLCLVAPEFSLQNIAQVSLDSSDPATLAWAAAAKLCFLRDPSITFPTGLVTGHLLPRRPRPPLPQVQAARAQRIFHTCLYPTASQGEVRFFTVFSKAIVLI